MWYGAQVVRQLSLAQEELSEKEAALTNKQAELGERGRELEGVKRELLETARLSAVKDEELVKLQVCLYSALVIFNKRPTKWNIVFETSVLLFPARL